MVRHQSIASDCGQGYACMHYSEAFGSGLVNMLEVFIHGHYGVASKMKLHAVGMA